jgi:MYXO-CTERM domain-containing protein
MLSHSSPPRQGARRCLSIAVAAAALLLSSAVAADVAPSPEHQVDFIGMCEPLQQVDEVCRGYNGFTVREGRCVEHPIKKGRLHCVGGGSGGGPGGSGCASCSVPGKAVGGGVTALAALLALAMAAAHRRLQRR